MKDHWKMSKINKKRLQMAKKLFQPAFMCMQQLKADQNTQQIDTAGFEHPSFGASFHG